MGLFSKSIGPVFLKEDSEANWFIEKMEAMAKEASPALKEEIEKQIRLASYGIAGEKNVAFELRNSGMDMFILHDIYLEYGDLSAQIDYMIICRHRIYVIECKNLVGDIEVDNNGQFVRRYEINGKKFKESIYSPITQNERHRNVIKEVRKADRSNIITKKLFENAFDDNYKSIVVLANPKSCLNDKYAKKEIKQQVIRADGLVAYIKKSESESTLEPMTEKQMREVAEFFLSKSVPNKSDYAKKYEELLEAEKSGTYNVQTPLENKENICPECGGKLVVRTASTGKYAGNKFWGCSNYPKCRFIKNIR